MSLFIAMQSVYHNIAKLYVKNKRPGMTELRTTEHYQFSISQITRSPCAPQGE